MKPVTKILFAILFISTQSILFAQTEAEQKAWMEYMTPSPVHKMLASADGNWNGAVTMWMADGAPPEKMTAISNNKMILGGRYQQTTVSGSMMGMPFEGMSILGYDNAQKLFKSTWIDNMGTGVMNLTGTWDEATNTMTMRGTSYDPLQGKESDVRQTFKIIDDKNQLMEMYMTKDGKEFKAMEIVYTR